jgi:hypothetical protein
MTDNAYLTYLQDVMGPVPDADLNEYKTVCDRLTQAEHLASGLDSRASVLIGMLTVRSAGGDYDALMSRLQGVLSNREAALHSVESLRRDRAALCAKIAQSQALRNGILQRSKQW